MNIFDIVLLRYALYSCKQNQLNPSISGLEPHFSNQRMAMTGGVSTPRSGNPNLKIVSSTSHDIPLYPHIVS
jgi:hypothetical protein